MDTNDDITERNWYADNQVLEVPTPDCRIKLQAAWHRALIVRAAGDSSRDEKKNTSCTQQDETQSRRRIEDAWFDRLWQLHTQPTRHYHTVMHLYEMVGYLEHLLCLDDDDHDHDESSKVNNNNNNKHLLSDAEHQAVLLAIFFHDAIYDTSSHTNEADSAKLFEEEFCRDMMMSHMPALLLQQAVVNLILATASHNMPTATEKDEQQVKNSNPYLSAQSMALFLDLDMAVLGKTEAAYNHYASLIRKEYLAVPHDVYCTKRATILETFLFNNDKPIFHSNYFRQALEARARENLQREIDLLKRNTIPGQL